MCERGLAQMQRGADVEVVQTSLEQAGRVSIGIGHFGGCQRAARCWYSVIMLADAGSDDGIVRYGTPKTPQFRIVQ